MIEIKNAESGVGEIAVISLTNSSGARVVLCSLGAGILEAHVPDREGRLADVALGYANLEDYMADGPCAGKTAGRFANRIAKGHLEIGGRIYELPVNCGPHHLHGGPEGFQNKLWRIEESDDSGVTFGYVSPDGEMGYPGEVTARVRYEWTERNELKITYKATADRPTVINLTNHTYWNLRGHGAGSALSHVLRVNASRYLETDPTLAPTGRLAPVEGTPMDFRVSKAVGRDMNADFGPLRDGKGYDHCWALDGDGSVGAAAELHDPESGRTLIIETDQPGVQVYAGNWLTGSPAGKEGAVYEDYDAVAIECQGFPDAPNHPEFPSAFLLPGQLYEKHINYIFR